MSKDISIIIVTFNGARFIKECISSVFNLDYDKNKYEIIIVDNCSKDESVLIVRNNFSEVRIIENSNNYGFGEACNITMAQCNCKYVVLLNQDSKVDKNWLKELVSIMDDNLDVAACGATEHPYNVTLPVEEALRNSKNIDDQVWIGGGSVLYRMSALKQIGFFDEAYFMYGEDIDLSWRLKLAGWRLVLNPKAIWHHYGHDRNNSNEKFRSRYAFKNRLYLLVKFGSISQIMKSLFLYSRRIKLFGFILLIAPFILPKAISARLRLDIPKQKRKDVDSWIRYTDKQLFK